jgi:transposase
MVQDEGRFGRITAISRCWSPIGQRSKVPFNMVREYIYAYSAVAPSIGEITSLILPDANVYCMDLFLKHVSKEFNEYFIVMQVDQAIWHKTDKLKVPDNIRLLYQPAYSPELNAVEHVWDEIKEKHFKNKIFKSIEDVVNKLSDALNSLKENKELVKSMTSFKYYPSFTL